jgi:uroporphyrinogen-III decarboxylase
MNARTRYLNSLLGGDIDRFFRYEFGPWPSTLELWKEEGLPHDTVIEGSRGTEEITFRSYFQFDELYRIPVDSGYTDSPFFPKFDEAILEKSMDHHIVRDVDGVIKKIFIKDPDKSMPRFLEFPVKTRDDWEKLKKDHLDISRISGSIGDIKKISEDICEKDREFPVCLTACGGFGHPRNLMGDENLSYAYFDEPGMIKDMMQNWLDVNKEIIRLVAEYIEIDNYLIWEDMSYKNGPLISPKMFEEFISPYYARLIGYAKEHRVKTVMVDTDGDCRKLIPLFLDAGVDALMPFEVQAGMDIVQTRKDFGDRLAIVGGIDKRALSLDKNAIKKEVDRVLPFFAESGRYIPCLDHTIPFNISLDNFKYYLEYLRTYEV